MLCSKKHIGFLCILITSILLSACTKNSSIISPLSTVMGNYQAGFWIALQAEENMCKKGETYTVEISFGTCAQDLECFTVDVFSEDFNIIKRCPDIYIVDGIIYTDNDFFVKPSHQISPEDLPQRFTVSFNPIPNKDSYSGKIEIIIKEQMIGGYASATVSLYYYGSSNLICFSTSSQQEAKNFFYKQKQ
jgi:hypothetical protein